MLKVCHRLLNECIQQLKVRVNLFSTTADDVDYNPDIVNPPGGILVFPANSSPSTKKCAFIRIVDDDFVEVTESFNVGGSVIAYERGTEVAFIGGDATVCILDSDGQCI